MKATTVKVPVGKIISTTDRRHGGHGDIESLARSIGEHGLIQPPVVKKERGGFYRVIAGRRRAEAVKLLGWDEVTVTVYPPDAGDEAIALAENVNREEMHPLDEAETFRRLVDEGQAVEEIAGYYSRSVSAIYHRIRLIDLIDGIKTMFRDGKINITSAALIASLPEGDQEKFLKKFGERPRVERWDVNVFMSSVRKSTLDIIADGECGACKKRTHNAAPGLFEDYDGEDVCFDGDCYAKKWTDLVAGVIAGEAGQCNPTENSVVFGNGIPKIFPAKAGTASIGGEGYTVLPTNGYEIKPTDKKAKAGTAWHVYMAWDGPSKKYKVAADRVVYRKCERDTDSQGGYDPLSQYAGLISGLPEIKEEDRKAVAKKVDGKYNSSWRLKHGIKEELLETIMARQIKAKHNENWAAAWLADKYSGEGENGEPHGIDPDYEGLAQEIFGPMASFSEIPKGPMLQKIFLFLTVAGLEARNLPDIDDSEAQWRDAEKSLFWKFAGVTREEYLDMYRERLSSAVAEVCGQPNSGGKSDG